jgi:hypothetical protein
MYVKWLSKVKSYLRKCFSTSTAEVNRGMRVFIFIRVVYLSWAAEKMFLFQGVRCIKKIRGKTFTFKKNAMTPHVHAVILYFYGIFLISCGFIAVIFIGLKAKTALASGGMSGLIAIMLGYLVQNGNTVAGIGGVVLAFALFCVFAWRTTKTLHKIFELIPTRHPDLNGKAIAFLIISLMAVMSMVIFMRQLVSLI